MAQQDVSELLNALRPALQAAAKNVLRHAYGPDGMPWGTRFSDLEDMAVQVGRLLETEVLGAALRGQAASPPPADLRGCPTCAGPLNDQPPDPRHLDTRAGPVAWDEPTAFCPRCRRAFFPSVQEPGP
jgi:hypothetical protein